MLLCSALPSPGASGRPLRTAPRPEVRLREALSAQGLTGLMYAIASGAEGLAARARSGQSFSRQPRRRFLVAAEQ